MAEPERYVLIEFRGGPKDGEQDVWSYPLVCDELQVAICRPLQVAIVPPGVEGVMVWTHSYRVTDTDYSYDVVTVAPELAAVVRDNKARLGHLLRGKRPLIFTHCG